MPTPLLTVAQVATELAVSPRTVQRLIARNELLGVRVGRVWRVEPEMLAMFRRGEKPVIVPAFVVLQ